MSSGKMDSIVVIPNIRVYTEPVPDQAPKLQGETMSGKMRER